MPKLKKTELHAELIARMVKDLESLESAHHATVEGATHSEAKSEGDKDTRAIEQQYLARGQAMRVEELRVATEAVKKMPLAKLENDAPVKLGALVRVEENEEEQLLFIASEGGGTSLAGGTVQVVTTKSPLGRELVGKQAGDECEVTIGPK